MNSIKTRISAWRSKTLFQKAGDVFFWALLILLIIPPTRKYIATSVNQIVLHVRKPGSHPDARRASLSEQDYRFLFSDSMGKTYSLADFKGEVLFVNFWATWCPPCLAELPGIEALYADYGDKVSFILITNQAPGEVQAFIENKKLEAPVYYQHGPQPPSLQSPSIPTSYIIGRDGRIAGKYTGAMDWNSKRTRKMLDELLAQEVLR